MSAHSLTQVVVESETVRTLFYCHFKLHMLLCGSLHVPSRALGVWPHNEWESHWAIYKAAETVNTPCVNVSAADWQDNYLLCKMESYLGKESSNYFLFTVHIYTMAVALVMLLSEKLINEI